MIAYPALLCLRWQNFAFLLYLVYVIHLDLYASLRLSSSTREEIGSRQGFFKPSGGNGCPTTRQ
jgi:hypothetical protein